VDQKKGKIGEQWEAITDLGSKERAEKPKPNTHGPLGLRDVVPSRLKCKEREHDPQRRGRPRESVLSFVRPVAH